MYGFVATGVLSASRVRQGAFVARKPVAVRRPAAARMRMSVEPVTAAASMLIAEGGGMEVTFPAYLAIFLGTLIPIAFLILLYVQSEARKAGEREAE
mmetsp:Transcript_1882/g.5672  ORF Transcript_1882/g.5672 Transcript_1882/m.5672 type:complete len:97 (+) Transcript_1882:201-491(+)